METASAQADFPWSVFLHEKHKNMENTGEVFRIFDVPLSSYSENKTENDNWINK